MLTHEREFVCNSYGECKNSHQGPDANFYEGQLHHVGRFYDISVDDRPFRIMVVGQEVGAPPARVLLPERQNEIAGCYLINRFNIEGPNHPGRNPHMRGTTSALRVLFGGDPGDDFAGEWVTAVDGQQVPHP